MKKNKDYEVEIYARYGNGRYGIMHYFGWVLNDTSIENVKSFAAEILAGMTYQEIHDESNGQFPITWIHDVNEKIGFDKVDGLFTIKAKVFKG